MDAHGAVHPQTGGGGSGHPLDAELDRMGGVRSDDLGVAADSVAPTPRVRGAASPAGPPAGGAGTPTGKIRTFQQTMGAPRADDADWKRRPRSTGVGAVHVKSFHCKLSSESLEFLDQQINAWLDEHPTFEVKMVTTTVGDWTGKLREPALIVNVWV